MRTEVGNFSFWILKEGILVRFRNLIEVGILPFQNH